MTSRTLLISDLHLQESRPDITHALLGFLDANKSRCDVLYILGDLFESWIGDDEKSPLSDTVAGALKEFNTAGSRIQIMHGNRDFLLGSSYAERCGASILEDQVIIDTACGSVLLLHGDSLCIDDIDYIQFRDKVRSQSWQQEFLAKSLDERRAFATEARSKSRTATASKENSIMDVNQAEVEKLLIETAQTNMIHGHTHRPAVHKLELSGTAAGNRHAQRVVLGDWEKNPFYAEITKQGIKLEKFQASSEGSSE